MDSQKLLELIDKEYERISSSKWLILILDVTLSIL
jgi:hypothetical protein